MKTILELMRIETPLGPANAVLRDGVLCDFDFASIWPAKQKRLARRFGDPRLRDIDAKGPVFKALTAYFEGNIQAIDELVLDPGGTEFQRMVWAALRDIPAGTTQTYGEFARHLGRPQAPRAVGAANGQNPIAIVIPCHRLIGAHGALARLDIVVGHFIFRKDLVYHFQRQPGGK